MADGTQVRPLISGDSHVIEPTEIWDGVLPDGFWTEETSLFSQRPGGFDPKARTDEMDTDNVSAEVLYPSLAMRLFGLQDAGLQARCFRRYNEWLAEYCTASPRRLAGIGLIPAYDIDVALAEVAWCKDNGMRGVMVWQTPPDELPFSGSHYEPLWEACSESDLSVSIHILTGFGYAHDIYTFGSRLVGMGLPMFRLSINRKLGAVQDSLLDIVGSGALDRHRDLRLVLVENECAWLPFFVDQLDYYYHRYPGKSPIVLERPPSEQFREQVFTTFFRDPNVELVVNSLGDTNLMWSSDYPHGNSTWPNSQQVVHDSLIHTPEASVRRLVWENAVRVFGLNVDPASGANEGAA